MCVAGGGKHGSWSPAGFSTTVFPPTTAALFTGSASAFLSASSLSSASFGTASQALWTSGAALGLPGGVFAGGERVGGGFELGIAVGLPAEPDSSLLSLLRGASFSTAAFKTQRESGASSASGSPFATTE